MKLHWLALIVAVGSLQMPAYAQGVAADAGTGIRAGAVPIADSGPEPVPATEAQVAPRRFATPELLSRIGVLERRLADERERSQRDARRIQAAVVQALARARR